METLEIQKLIQQSRRQDSYAFSLESSIFVVLNLTAKGLIVLF